MAGRPTSGGSGGGTLPRIAVCRRGGVIGRVVDSRVGPGSGAWTCGVAAAEAKVGKGKVFLLGPEITFSAQPHGTFKFLFNGIYYGTSVPAGANTSTTTNSQRN